ncbi:MAG: carotenoid oxygenase family protein, partial [Cyanobacteria bacterium P01_F01_bin.153]
MTLIAPDRNSSTRSQTGDRPLWYSAMEEPATPFETQAIPVVEGRLPEDLSGTLYRNGPGQLVRDGVRTGHWFDGDGAMLAVRFAGGEATATYKYVDTAARREEEQAGRWLYGNYGMLPAGNWWQRMTGGRSLKNAANTSVLALPDRLLALWEGGRPHRLNLDTLETLGLEDFGELPSDRSYSAHPKIDPKSGEIYNFGMVPGPVSKLWLYRSNSTGKLLKQRSLTLPRISLTHDFALAGPYLVFCIPPTQLQLAPVIFSLKSFSDSLEWKPKIGTTILIFDRETL